MIRFLVDAQLPSALARAMSRAGFEAEHVRATGRQSAVDSAIWAYAAQAGLAIVTKDEDFARRRLSVRSGPQIVWVRFANLRTRALVARMVPALPSLVAMLECGEPLVVLFDEPAPNSTDRPH